MAADGGLDKQSQAIILIEERQSQQWKLVRSLLWPSCFRPGWLFLLITKSGR